MPIQSLLLFILLSLPFQKIYGQYCTNDIRYTEKSYFDSTQISVASNVQFGSALDHLGNAYTLRMDIYYPNLTVDLSPKRPFIMLFHGGGFSSGDKQSGDIKDLCIHMAMRGYVCATVNYRIGYNFTEYGQYKARYRAIQDGHAAMRYIVQNANSIRIDTNWLFVGGQSAGSLLALGMVYADPNELDSVSLLYNSTSVSSELGNLYTSGNNLTNTYSIKGIFNNWGAVTKSEMDVNEMLPTIAFHGKLDTTVRIDADNSLLHYVLYGSKAIHTELLAQNICCELTVDTLGEHGIYRNASSVFRAGRASCFFKSVFCNTCTNFYSTDSVASKCSTPLSIASENSATSIIVYPNPFKDVIQLCGLKSAANLSIYNCYGQLIYNTETTTGEIPINLPSGIYSLIITPINSSQSRSIRLIKE